jgi:hypothetical protein
MIKKIHFKAVALGFITGTAADLLGGLIIGLFCVATHSTTFQHYHGVPTIPLSLLELAIGLVTGILAGAITYNSAKQFPMLNVSVLGIFGVILSLLTIPFFSHSLGPLWYVLTGIVLIYPTCYFGGSLAGKNIRATHIFFTYCALLVLMCWLIFSTRDVLIAGFHPSSIGQDASKILEEAEMKLTSSSEIEEELPLIAAAINKVLPEEVDPFTRLDKVDTMDGKKMSFSFTLLAPFDAIKDLSGEKLRKLNVETACKDPLIEKLLSLGVAIEFRRIAKDGILLGDDVIIMTDCASEK